MVKMKMLKIQNILLLIILASIIIINSAFAGYSGSSPNWTCTVDSLTTVLGLYTAGDTITVTDSGTFQVDIPIVITKGCNIISNSGATLLGNVGYTNFMVTYQPDSTNISNNTPFRISGFIFDLNHKAKGLLVRNATATPINKVRVDHNTFKNAYSYSYQAFNVYGTIYGTLDNNTFNDNCVIQMYGSNATSWNNLIYIPGSVDNFYIEDNVFNTTTTNIAGGEGGRYVARYNTINHSGSSSWSPVFDAHGNQYNGNTAMMGVEIYGNNLIDSAANCASRFLQHRGGIGQVFFNYYHHTALSCSGPGIDLLEEYTDDIQPVSNPAGQPQHISESYYWSNFRDSTQISVLVGMGITEEPYSLYSYNCGSTVGTWTPETNYQYPYCRRFDNVGAGNKVFKVYTSGISKAGTEPEWNKVLGSNPPNGQTIDGTVVWIYQDDGTPIEENNDYFIYDPGFTGVTGMGCGTLASRPATCTVGVGYWATNQSCSDLSGMVGANPATPISGTLYKCTAPNTWTAYYAPYTYPHPLRGPFASSQKLGVGSLIKNGEGSTIRWFE